MLPKPITAFLYCLSFVVVTFTGCKKDDVVSPAPFADGAYNGTVIITSVKAGNKTQTTLPFNISFVNGSYYANTIPRDQLPYVDIIPYIGIYQLSGNASIVLSYTKGAQSLPDPGFLTGQFAITAKADSVILTNTLPDGVSEYQFRLKIPAK